MSGLQRWRCDVCGYVHEGPEPPAVCPVCGVGPELFSAIDPAAAPVVEVAAAPKPERTHGGSGDRIVVVGAGVAGVTAAEHARKHSRAGVVLINKEPDPPYVRLNLTRWLAREVTQQALELKPARWYQEQGIELHEGEVVAVDRGARELRLRDGSRLEYRRLVLAHGAHPFVPPIPGVAREGVTAVRTLAHARAVLALASPGARAVVIGGGVLGLEAAAALNAHGVTVTVLEGFEWLLPRQLARPAAEIVQAHLYGLGITVICSAKVSEIAGDESVRAVKLASGEELAADVVLIAAGVRANRHLAVDCGLITGQGVVVDDAMRTSDPDVFAAGDVAEHRGVLHGLWTVALDQGRVAGANAAGAAELYAGAPPANQLKILDVPVFSLGAFAPTDPAFAVLEHRPARGYRRIVCHGGAIVGANLVGDLGLAPHIKKAVEERTRLAELPSELRALPELAALSSALG